jgi:hypothetical protein
MAPTTTVGAISIPTIGTNVAQAPVVQALAD